MEDLLVQIRGCTVCAPVLPDGPRPIVQASVTARIVIIGQAPGRRVHESGIPWDDPSGKNLRGWLGVTDEVFYDPSLVALMPMGFFYPGSTSAGDNPPRLECAPLWHDRILGLLPPDRLEVIVGAYAPRRYLAEGPSTLTEAVATWADHLPDRVVLPHPSPRNRRWLTNNPWFESDVVPAVRRRVRAVLATNRDQLELPASLAASSWSGSEPMPILMSSPYRCSGR